MRGDRERAGARPGPPSFCGVTPVWKPRGDRVRDPGRPPPLSHSEPDDSAPLVPSKEGGRREGVGRGAPGSPGPFLPSSAQSYPRGPRSEPGVHALELASAATREQAGRGKSCTPRWVLGDMTPEWPWWIPDGLLRGGGGRQEVVRRRKGQGRHCRKGDRWVSGRGAAARRSLSVSEMAASPRPKSRFPCLPCS